MSKEIKNQTTSESTEYGVESDDFQEVMPKLEPQLKDGDKVHITAEGSTPVANPIQHAFFAGLVEGNGSIDGTFVGDMSQNAIAINLWKQYELANVKETDGGDNSEVDSLYSGADDRAIEYGIRNEDFDKMMSELKEDGAPTINITEEVNPRITKGDLINYIKNKNNVK